MRLMKRAKNDWWVKQELSESWRQLVGFCHEIVTVEAKVVIFTSVLFLNTNASCDPADLSGRYEERGKKNKKNSASLSANESAQLPAGACEMLMGRFKWLGDVDEEVSGSCTLA